MITRFIKEIAVIRRSLLAERPRPLSLSVNITGRCNLRCGLCEKGQSPSNNEIDVGDIKWLIDFACKNNMTVYLSGGEPFLHRSIWEILDYCRQVGKKISIVTNGSLLDGMTMEQFTLLGQTINIMSISIDSAVPAEHDRLRGMNGTFDRLMSFIRDERRTCRVGLNCILMNHLNGAAEMIDLAEKLGCSLNFLPLIFESNYPGQPRLELKKQFQQQLAAATPDMANLRMLQRRANLKSVVTNLSLISRYFESYCRYAAGDSIFFDKLLKRFMCFTPLTQIIVDERGRLAPCVLFDGARHVRDGDLYENWLKQALNHRRRWIEGERYATCRACSCHFADNYRASILSFPLANFSSLPWLVSYYVRRVLHGEGRK